MNTDMRFQFMASSSTLMRGAFLAAGGALLAVAPGFSAPAAPAPAASAPAEAAIVPSRYAGADVEGYIQTLNARLAITKRATDPFGQVQDPTAKAAKLAAPKATPKATQNAAAKPLSEIVKQLKVTTVMPGEGRFLVGTRSISRGENFPLVAQGKRYRVEVVEISAQHILFRDLETEEQGELRLDVMPQGMSRGIQGVLAPGMQPAQADAPLELDVPNSTR